jgi:predicted metal-dependent hydrolase
MQLTLPLVEAPSHAGGVPVHLLQQSGARYYVRHQRARRYVLRVDADGLVRVTIPRGGSRREADAFADRNHGWVQGQLARLQTRAMGPRANDPIARQRAGRELPHLLLGWADRLGLHVAAVSVRNQRTRWGSCGRNGHVSLNWRLVLMPDWVRDYVMVHELMHLRRMDHSPKYWSLVAAAYPRYQEARAWLRQSGPGLR